jgi:hypothetical protein
MIQIKIDDAILTLDVDRPDKRGVPIWTGDYAEIAAWLPNQYGLRGHKVGENPRPRDVIHALIAGKKRYEIIEGKEILDLPEPKLPKGAIE